MKRSLEWSMNGGEDDSNIVSLSTLEIEARMRSTCTMERDVLIEAIVKEVIAQFNSNNNITYGTLLSIANLTAHIERLRVCSYPPFKCNADNAPRVYLYALAPEHSRVDQVGEQEDASMVTFSQWTLPCPEFEGLWESLIFDDDLQVSMQREFGFASSLLTPQDRVRFSTMQRLP